MDINVVVEPQYMQALWCRQTLAGIEETCHQRKYALQILALEAVLGDPAFHGPVILVGTSQNWVPGALAALSERGIEAVLVSYLDPGGGLTAAATVAINHELATLSILHALRAWGRTRTALYGVNPNSAADRLKLRAFRRAGGREEDIYPNHGALAACAASFFPRAHQYDSVLLVNDIVGVSFLHRAKDAGIRVPEDLYAASFGGSQIATRTSPTLTTFSLEHQILGRQAVWAYTYLLRLRDGARLSILVPFRFYPGQSTEMRPLPAAMPDALPDAPAVDFYDDPETDAILRLETLLNLADATDLALIDGLMRGQGYEALADACHVAPGTVKYRLRRMLQWAGLPDRRALYALLKRYLYADAPAGSR